MVTKKRKTVVRKTTFEEEQMLKDTAFLKMSPRNRLRIHEELRKRIWGKQYNKLSLKGLRVTKNAIPK